MKVVIDSNNKQQRAMVINATSKTIGQVKRGEGDMNRAFHIEDMEVIESVMKRQEEIIEEQEERIAIMEEGGWRDAKTDPPKKPGTYIVYVKVLGERIPYVSFCDYQIKTTGFDLEGNAMVLKWQNMPEPPKEGET